MKETNDQTIPAKAPAIEKEPIDVDKYSFDELVEAIQRKQQSMLVQDPDIADVFQWLLDHGQEPLSDAHLEEPLDHKRVAHLDLCDCILLNKCPYRLTKFAKLGKSEDGSTTVRLVFSYKGDVIRGMFSNYGQAKEHVDHFISLYI